MSDANQPAAGDVAAAEEEKKEEAEPESYGYPHSLLLANDIEPSILTELPDDVREAVLMPLQV